MKKAQKPCISEPGISTDPAAKPVPGDSRTGEQKPSRRQKSGRRRTGSQAGPLHTRQREP